MMTLLAKTIEPQVTSDGRYQKLSRFVFANPRCAWLREFQYKADFEAANLGRRLPRFMLQQMGGDGYAPKITL